LFKKFRRNSAVARLIEEQLYGQVTAELDQGIRRAGLWGKALAKSRGNENEALALYMQLRVQSLRDEAEIAGALIEEGFNQQEILDYETANQSQAESLAEEDLKEVKSQLEKEKQKSASLAREIRWKEKVANGRLGEGKIDKPTQHGATVEDDIIERARVAKAELARSRVSRDDEETARIKRESWTDDQKAEYWAGRDEQKAMFWRQEAINKKKLEGVEPTTYELEDKDEVVKDASYDKDLNAALKLFEVNSKLLKGR